MLKQIYARFPDIDHAEAAARTLRSRCGGIRKMQIHRRASLQSREASFSPALTALYGNGAICGGVQDAGGIQAGVIPFLPETETPAETAAAYDGPAGRTDCLLEVKTDSRTAPFAEAVLRSEHGLQIFTGDLG